MNYDPQHTNTDSPLTDSEKQHLIFLAALVLLCALTL